MRELIQRIEELTIDKANLINEKNALMNHCIANGVGEMGKDGIFKMINNEKADKKTTSKSSK